MVNCPYCNPSIDENKYHRNPNENCECWSECVWTGCPAANPNFEPKDTGDNDE